MVRLVDMYDVLVECHDRLKKGCFTGSFILSKDSAPGKKKDLARMWKSHTMGTGDK